MQAGTPRPNIVVFFTDQQRWDTAGVHGNPLDLTPHFDGIARRGSLFEYAFTPQPLCGPARAGLQTGVYPTTIGCFRNAKPLPADASTLAHWLAGVGYQTGYIGKWHLASKDPVPRAERAGYQTWLAANRLEWTSHPYDTRLFDEEDREVRLPGYRTDALVDAAIRHIDTVSSHNSTSPFFLFLSLLEPHHQNDIDRFVAPDGYERFGEGWVPPDLRELVGSSRQQLPGYLGMIKRIDEGVGRILDALKSLGLDDNTIVVYTSDHGCHFKTRNNEYKRSPHEASIRIPMAAQGPYFDERGVISRLVTLLDVPTMLADAAGADVGPGPVGRTLGKGEARTALLGDDPALEGEDDGFLIQLSEVEVGRALRTRRWKYGVIAPDADLRAVGTASHYSERYLYDLEADPSELTNLATDRAYEGVRDALRRSLLRRMEAAGDEPATIGAAPIGAVPIGAGS